MTTVFLFLVELISVGLTFGMRTRLFSPITLNETFFGYDEGPKSLVERGCRIQPSKKSVQTFHNLLSTYSVSLFEFEVRMLNYTNDPFKNQNASANYKPWLWNWVRSKHGKTLLMLSFHYDILSMSILSIGVEKLPMHIVDSPSGCFQTFSVDQQMMHTRKLLFMNFGKFHDINSPRQIEFGISICNMVVNDIGDGYGTLQNRCCDDDGSGTISCSDTSEDGWITVLYVSLALVRVAVFCLCPLMLPETMYSAMYYAAEYVVYLKKEIKMKIFITDSKDTSIRYKDRITKSDIREWSRFRQCIDELPYDKIIPVKVSELRIKVKGKRIITGNEPPTGLLRTIYDNLIRCKIKAINPFRACCDLSVYSSLEPFISHQFTWHMFVQYVVKVLVLIVIPLPFYVRLIVYYFFEETELTLRRQAINRVGLNEKFNMFRSNLIQYFTPVHPVFIVVYILYFLSGISLGFATPKIRNKIKTVVRNAFQDMSHVSRVGVLQIILRIALHPFMKCGLLGILVAPIFWVITSPIYAFLVGVYCIPTVYLTYRLFYQARKVYGLGEADEEHEKKLTRAQQAAVKVKDKAKRWDKKIHLKRMGADPMPVKKRTEETRFCGQLKAFLLQVAVGILCVLVLHGIVLVIVESISLIIEALAFTMMGIIVNAGATLRYVSMVVLVFVYMNNCYNNVYSTYQTFGNTIVENIMDRTDDLKTIASLPSSVQENVAFQLKPIEEADEIKPTLNFKTMETRWRIGHLLLFLDSLDTPRIPLNLFKKMCDVRVFGSPGPVYMNLLRATYKFLVIVIFLAFVMIVVMAFGNATGMSTTNQTLATMAGGFVPMLLRNVLSTKSVTVNLKTLSFKGQLDEAIADYKQNWPMNDMVIETDYPEPETTNDDKSEDGDTNDKRKTETGDKGDKDKGSDKDDKKEKKESIKGKFVKKKESVFYKPYSDDTPPPYSAAASNSLLNPLDYDGLPARLSRMRRASIVNLEDNFVDLFVDLSNATETVESLWNSVSYGSSQSLQSTTMMPNYIYHHHNHRIDESNEV